MTAERRTVAFSAVTEALQLLGITEDPEDIMSVHVVPQAIILTTARRNGRGNKFVVGDQLATDSVRIDITYGA